MWAWLLWMPLMLLLLLWSGLCWAVHRFVSGAGGDGAGGAWQTGDTEGWVLWLEQWRIPVWLADWLPMDLITAIKAAMTTVLPMLADMLGNTPELTTWLPPLVLVTWLIGTSALVFVGLVLGALIGVVRRDTARAAWSTAHPPGSGGAPGTPP
jgi:hypothetical protein